MNCLILAAGYATRLYPLTEHFPKPLLKVGEKTIVDWLIDDLRTAGVIDRFVVVTNHKFAGHFEAWAREKDYPITVVDDGTSTNETRLGAVCDIRCAQEQLGLSDDLLVLAGDNVLDFSLTAFLRYCRERKTSCVMRYAEPRPETLTKRGVLELKGDRVIGMEEKPAVPKTNWCCPPFYFFTAADAARIPEALAEGCGSDAPGSFIAWLCRKATVHAMEMPGSRYDIGDLKSYEQVQKEYKGITNHAVTECHAE